MPEILIKVNCFLFYCTIIPPQMVTFLNNKNIYWIFSLHTNFMLRYLVKTYIYWISISNVKPGADQISDQLYDLIWR